MRHNHLNEIVSDLRIAFDLLDRNQDGRVTAGELQFMLKNLGIIVRDELIDDLIKEASHGGNQTNLNLNSSKQKRNPLNHFVVCARSGGRVSVCILGNGLMDEKEFRQWIQRIQALQEESTVTPSTSQSETDDDVTQDLIAAFR